MQSEDHNQENDRVVIPARFSRMVDAHLLGNMLEIAHYPLILAINGRPGMGKTYQLRKYLEAVGITIFSISAADLESERAGAPAKLLQERYIVAGSRISKRNTPSVLLIDDIDTTMGEWENHTGTVNHQDILAFLMHIADNPHHIESVTGELSRVPIFFTGNYFDRLYKPLIREGRANRFDWEPNREEKIEIVSSIFQCKDTSVAEMLVDAYPDEKISFFSNLMVSKNVELLAEVVSGELSRATFFQTLLTDANYKEKIYRKYCDMEQKVPWNQIAREALRGDTVFPPKNNR